MGGEPDPGAVPRNGAVPLEVVAAVIIEEGRVLLAQRRPEDRFPLYWEFPGGKVEPGETHAEALARELMEELALAVEADALYGRARYQFPTGARAEIYFYRARRLAGEPAPLEVFAWQWADAHRLAELEIIPSNRELVKRLREELAGS